MCRDPIDVIMTLVDRIGAPAEAASSRRAIKRCLNRLVERAQKNAEYATKLIAEYEERAREEEAERISMTRICWFLFACLSITGMWLLHG